MWAIDIYHDSWLILVLFLLHPSFIINVYQVSFYTHDKLSCTTHLQNTEIKICNDAERSQKANDGVIWRMLETCQS